MMLASCWQKIESRYPRFGLQDMASIHSLPAAWGSREPQTFHHVCIMVASCPCLCCSCRKKTPFSCRYSQNVTDCQKEICWTCFFKESIAAFFLGVSKHPLSTRSLRLLRATVRSTSSALWLHHAHPFVATEEKRQSHAEKQRVLSRSCGLQDLLQYSDCALSCAMRLCECCKPMNNCRDWAFSKQWVGSRAASLSAADVFL